MSTTIIDGIKQYIIENIDPSKLHEDPLQGLKLKEDMLKMYDPCMMRDHLPNYDDMEEMVTSFMGDRFTDLLLNRLDFDDLKPTLPEIEVVAILDIIQVNVSSSSSSFHIQTESAVAANDDCVAVVSIWGGENIKLENFDTFEWRILSGPEGSNIEAEKYNRTINEDQIYQRFIMNFSHSGTYTLMVTAISKYTYIRIYNTYTLEVN